jgi:hypothetical protein
VEDTPGIDGAFMLPPDGAAKVVITVQVEDLGATVEKAKAEGGAVAMAMAMAKIPVPTVGWVAYVTDPQGTVMGLMQPDENVTG